MIKLSDISVTFDNQQIINNFNLEVQAGEFVCITGKTGCGKTTILNIISLLFSNYTGTVEMFGHQNPKFNSKVGTELLKNKLGLVFQNNVLLESKTVLENLNIAYHKDGFMSIDQALEFVGLPDIHDKLVYKLSGGEQQRVALARVLIKQFDVLIGDEITGSLDHNTRDQIMKILQQLQKAGKTIILVTHDPEVVSYGSREIKI